MSRKSIIKQILGLFFVDTASISFSSQKQSELSRRLNHEALTNEKEGVIAGSIVELTVWKETADILVLSRIVVRLTSLPDGQIQRVTGRIPDPTVFFPAGSRQLNQAVEGESLGFLLLQNAGREVVFRWSGHLDQLRSRPVAKSHRFGPSSSATNEGVSRATVCMIEDVRVTQASFVVDFGADFQRNWLSLLIPSREGSYDETACARMMECIALNS